MSKNTLDPSKPLQNAKHEKFARLIAKAQSGRDAYRGAGFTAATDNAADASASRLLATAKVRARVDNLTAKVTAKAVEDTGVNKAKVIAELAKIGFSNMLDYVTINARGEAYADLSKLTRDQAAAIVEVTSEIYMEGEGDEAKPVKRTKFKLADKRAALVDIGKELGMFVKKVEVGGPGDFASLTEDELLALEDEISEKIEEINTSGVTHSGSGAVN